MNGQPGRQQPTPGGGRTWGWEVAALVVAVVAVAARCLNWHHVFSPEGVVLPAADPYYHLWRARMLVDAFPGLPKYDHFISFPVGAHIPWPPGFDMLLALPALLTGDKSLVAPWGAVLMPLLGGLGTYLLYRLGKLVFDRLTGLVAALFFALTVGSITYSYVGRVDHHGFVAPVILAMFLWLVRALDARSGRSALGFGLACAAMAAVSVASWIVTPPIYFLPVVVTVAAVRLWGQGSLRNRAGIVVLLASLLLVTVVVLAVGSLDDLPFTLYQPSWFTVLLFGLAVVAVVPPLVSWRLAAIVWAAAAAGLLVLALVTPQVFAPLGEALRVAGGKDVSYSIATESNPLFFFGGTFLPGGPVFRYTNLLLLAPMCLLVYLWFWWRRHRAVSGRILLAWLFPYALVLMLVQNRFGEFSAPFLSLLFAWALVAGLRTFGRFYRRAPSRLRATVWLVLLLAGLAAALLPIPRALISLARSDPVELQRKAYGFTRELRAVLPEPVRQGRPAYGLLTSWNLSHLVLARTGAAVMVSSFATAEALRQNRQGFAILLDHDEERAWRRLVKNRIRYLVIDPIVSQVDDMSAMAGLPRQYMAVTTTPRDDGFKVSYQPLQPFSQALHTRLEMADGSLMAMGGGESVPLTHFRLVLESQQWTVMFQHPFAVFKAFEVVTGARLQGQAEPGQLARLRLTVRTNRGRALLYENRTNADASGRFGFVVPYPTEDYGAPCRAQGPYRIKVGQRVYHVEVAEKDVQQGRTIVVE